MEKDKNDISILKDILEPFRRIVNAEPPKNRLSTAQTKLIFSECRNSPNREGFGEMLGKRKSSFEAICTTPENKKMKTDNSFMTPSSPWEVSRLKADVIGLKAQVISLETRNTQLHALRKEMAILFESEKAALEQQHERDERAVKEMEERLKVVKKREAELRQELDEAIREKINLKSKSDKEKYALEKSVADLKEKLFDGNLSTNDQLSEMKKDMDELSLALSGAQQEIEMLKRDLELKSERALKANDFEVQCERLKGQLLEANRQIKSLEYDREAHKDWQIQARIGQKRLAHYPDLEKENARLRANERNLRDAISNKLILEEQVHTLSSRLDTLQPLSRELQECKVKLSMAESSVREWESLSNRVGVIGGMRGCSAVARALSEAQAGQIAATNERNNATRELQKITEEMMSVKHERDVATNKLSDLQVIRKNQDNLIHRLQKRLLLVTRERDSYRQQLDCYEKELSTTLSGEGDQQGQTTILTNRVQQLENTLKSYRNLVEKLEAQISSTANVPNPTTSDMLSRYKDENNQLKYELEKMRSKTKQMELQMETLSNNLRDQNTGQNKILHLRENPASIAQQKMRQEYEAALKEVIRLQAKVRSLQENPNLEVSSVAPCNAQEVAQLQQQIESSKIKLQRMKEEFTSAAQEYRDVCYMLLGYKIDRTGPKKYRISSMYADTAEEYLNFKVQNEGIEMVHTEYSASLSDLVETHLHEYNSIPMFLSSLTIDLFTKTTMAQEHQEVDEEEAEGYSDEDENAVHAIEDSSSEEEKAVGTSRNAAAMELQDDSSQESNSEEDFDDDDEVDDEEQEEDYEENNVEE